MSEDTTMHNGSKQLVQQVWWYLKDLITTNSNPKLLRVLMKLGLYIAHYETATTDVDYLSPNCPKNYLFIDDYSDFPTAQHKSSSNDV